MKLAPQFDDCTSNVMMCNKVKDVLQNTTCDRARRINDQRHRGTELHCRDGNTDTKKELHQMNDKMK